MVPTRHGHMESTQVRSKEGGKALTFEWRFQPERKQAQTTYVHTRSWRSDIFAIHSIKCIKARGAPIYGQSCSGACRHAHAMRPVGWGGYYRSTRRGRAAEWGRGARPPPAVGASPRAQVERPGPPEHTGAVESGTAAPPPSPPQPPPEGRLFTPAHCEHGGANLFGPRRWASTPPPPPPPARSPLPPPNRFPLPTPPRHW